MKKIIALALVAAFIFGGALSASATEIKAKGEFQFTFGYTDNPDMYEYGWDGQSEDGFYASQRTRVQVDFIASEMLRGVLYFEIGTIQWGRSTGPGGGDGGALGADGVNVATKRAYIDFMIPDTELMFRVGIQGLALPSYVSSNPIFDDDVAGVAAVWQITDQFGVTAFWARAYDLDTNTVSTKNSPDADELDAWGLILGYTGDGFELQAYGMFASVGRDVFPRTGGPGGLLSPVHALALSGAVPAGINPYPATSQAAQLVGLGNTFNNITGNPFLLNYATAYQAQVAQFTTPTYYYDNILSQDSYYPAWWLGVGGQIDMFDPIVIMFDAAYGSVEASDDRADRAGWYVAAEIDYKLDIATLGLMAFYGSGEDGNWSNGSEQLPEVSGYWGPTSFGFDGSSLDNAGAVFSDQPSGKWGLAFLVKDLTFIEDLTHQFRVMYARGTNDPDARRLVGVPELFYGTTGLAGFTVPTNILNTWGFKGYGNVGNPILNPLALGIAAGAAGGVLPTFNAQVAQLTALGASVPQAQAVALGLPAINPAVALAAQNLAFAQSYSALRFPATFNRGLNTGATGVQLTTEDYYWEVNFDHEYMIYENLSAILELGMFHAEYGDNTWVHDDTNTAWKAVFGLKYKF